MTSSSEKSRTSSTSILRGRQLSRLRVRLSITQLIVFVAALLLLPSVVEKAPLAAASAGQSSFEFAAYCQKLCIWGRGGNLCRCNAVHFVGKRRTPTSIPMRIRIDRSANISTGSQKPNGRPETSEDPDVSMTYQLSSGKIDAGTGQHAKFFRRVARWGHQKLEKVDGSLLSGYRREEDDDDECDIQQRNVAVVERKRGADEAKKGLGIAGGDREHTETSGRRAVRKMATIGSRYRRMKYFPVADDVHTTSVGPVINVFFRRTEHDGVPTTLARKMVIVRRATP